MHEISFGRCEQKDVSRRYVNVTRNGQIPGKGTYLADEEIRLLMKLKGAVKGGLNLRADLVLRLPDLLLLPLIAIKIRGDPGLDHRPLDPHGGSLGRPSTEATLRGCDKVGNPGSDASRGARINLLHVLELLWQLLIRHLHHRHHSPAPSAPLPLRRPPRPQPPWPLGRGSLLPPAQSAPLPLLRPPRPQPSRARERGLHLLPSWRDAPAASSSLALAGSGVRTSPSA